MTQMSDAGPCKEGRTWLHNNKVAAYTAQFVFGSKKYFNSYSAELNTKPKRDPPWELNCVYW